MLSFGLMCEYNIINNILGVILGFLFFIPSFTVLFYKFGIKTTDGIILTTVITLIWALYGVAAFFNYKIKNIMYNILDVFSKNFFGLFITIYLFM